MRGTHTIIFLLLGTIFSVAGYLTIRSFGILGDSVSARVHAVDSGCQEIAWISPATSITTWERMVDAAKSLPELLKKNNPGDPQIKVEPSNAFPRLSAQVPEFSIWLKNQENHRLVVRWYKVSSEVDFSSWLEKLAGRMPSPLAIIGGESTSQAVKLSLAMKTLRGNWKGEDPLLLLTTATADAYSLSKNIKQPEGALTDPTALKLMNIYKNRTVRFSFSNIRMTQAVMDFVQKHPSIWSQGPIPSNKAISAATNPNLWNALTILNIANQPYDYAMYGVGWADDSYSMDLRDRFLEEFQHRYHPLFHFTDNDVIPHSIGDFFMPGPQDIAAALHYPGQIPQSPTTRQMVVLPTAAARARRFLRALVTSSPEVTRNMVVLSGDSISFNQIYRDRKLAWNILDLPVPLVFFSHRNPMNSEAGFKAQNSPDLPWASSGTQDFLFYRDLLQSVALASFGKNHLVSSADDLDQAMGQLRWYRGQVTSKEEGIPLFSSRNRNQGTGEHVVLLKPQREGSRVLPRSSISVWSRRIRAGGEIHWVCDGEIPNVFYGDPNVPLQGGSGNGLSH